MSNIIQAEFLFSIGSIEIYQLKPSAFDLFKTTTYFWKYKGTMDIFGPFDTIMAATRNWESTIARPPQVIPENVIKIDFVSKKRIK